MDNSAKTAVEQGAIAGMVLLAADTMGKIDIHRSYGVRTLKNPNGPNPPMTEDTPLRMASFTKLVTAIMVLQGVEQGLVDLDAPVADKLPDIARMQVLKSYDGRTAVLEDPITPITIRHLLTHSAGTTYAAMVPDLSNWGQIHNIHLWGTGATVMENFGTPLAYHPSTDWGYGAGSDWSGLYLQKVTGMDLEDFMQKHVCKPLGIETATFRLQEHPEMIKTRGDIAERDPTTGKLSYVDRPYFHQDPTECLGGQGVFITPLDFFKILQSILRNDGKLLKPATRELLFRPALSPASEKRLNEKGVEMEAWKPHGLLTADVKKSHRLGGVLVTEDAPGGDWRKAGSISWSGMPNHFWTIDPKAGVCMMSAFHIDPWGDAKAFELGAAFEKEVYAMAG